MAPPIPLADYSHSVPQITNSASTNDSRPASSVPAAHVEHAVDDSMIRDQPSRYVDYLAHDWKEEDIWSSWKHIVSKREAHCDSARLENALWRTWTKSRHLLKTVPPEAVNWLKDCDVTWLYGPLQAISNKLSIAPRSLCGVGMSTLNFPLNQKLILKKRSLSDAILQSPLSASSLPVPAAAAVEAQRSNAQSPTHNSDMASTGSAGRGYITSPFSLRPLRRSYGHVFTSGSSWGEQSPETKERKHIRFSDKVGQWIAVDIADGDDDEEGLESYAIDDNNNNNNDDDNDNDDDDGSSDDGFLMMKGSSKLEILFQSNRSTPQTKFGVESSSVAVLPPTTLKYRE